MSPNKNSLIEKNRIENNRNSSLKKSHRWDVISKQIASFYNYLLLSYKKSACCYEYTYHQRFFHIICETSSRNRSVRQSRKIELLIEPIEHTKTLNLVTACTQEVRRGIDFIKLKHMSMIRERYYNTFFIYKSCEIWMWHSTYKFNY